MELMPGIASGRSAVEGQVPAGDAPASSALPGRGQKPARGPALSY
jgi:hypothetical protein